MIWSLAGVCFIRVPTRPHPQKPPGSLSLVSECPLPHTLGCPVSKNQPPHSARPLQFSPSDQYTGTRPPSTVKSYWDQDKEAGFFCPFPGSLLLPDWAAHLILRKPVSLPWTSDVMFCQEMLKKDSPSLSRVTSGNSGFPRLVPVTSGSFSGSLP